MAFRPKLPSVEKIIDVGIVFVILMVVFQLFPVLRFWEKVPSITKAA